MALWFFTNRSNNARPFSLANTLMTDNGQILDLDEIKTLKNTHSEYTSYVFKFTLILMAVCVALFVTDVIIRQLKWKDVVSFFKSLRRRKHEK